MNATCASTTAVRAVLASFNLEFTGNRKLRLPFGVIPAQAGKPAMGVIRMRHPARKRSARHRKRDATG